MVPADADALGLRPFVADVVDELDLIPFFQLIETGAGDIVAMKVTLIAIRSFNEAKALFLWNPRHMSDMLGRMRLGFTPQPAHIVLQLTLGCIERVA